MKVLITGGCGFIGANMLRLLKKKNNVNKIIILDNLSTGNKKNIESLLNDSRFEFVQGDITDYSVCDSVMREVEYVVHLAALGSVPRSLEHPEESIKVNDYGTVNLLTACVRHDIKRIVFASSSAVYGDRKGSPKVEDNVGSPLSPYAASKMSMERYADVYKRVYGLDYVALRYFNVFGPFQAMNSVYAAVIPVFCHKIMSGMPPIINGSDTISRDFTFVDNVTQANYDSLVADIPKGIAPVFNIACGESHNLGQLVSIINKIYGSDVRAQIGPPRKGDISASLASIEKANRYLNYEPAVGFESGIEKTMQWYIDNQDYLKGAVFK